MCFALIASQVLGSIATICARAFGPNSVGPGPISPDMTQGAHALANAWFWVALFCQLLIWYVEFFLVSFVGIISNIYLQCWILAVLP